jgi:hypothetical protein
MRLPTSYLHQFSQSGSVRPLQQIEDGRGFATIPRPALLLRGLRRFLRGAGLLGRLTLRGRNVRALLASAGLFAGFGLLSRRLGGGFFSNRGHCDLLWRGFRDHMNRSEGW